MRFKNQGNSLHEPEAEEKHESVGSAGTTGLLEPIREGRNLHFDSSGVKKIKLLHSRVRIWASVTHRLPPPPSNTHS